MTRVSRATSVLLQLPLICTYMYMWRAAVTRQNWRGRLLSLRLHRHGYILSHLVLDILVCGYGHVGIYTDCLVWYRPPRVMAGVGPTPRMCSVFDVIGRESWDRVVSDVFVFYNSAPKGGVKSTRVWIWCRRDLIVTRVWDNCCCCCCCWMLLFLNKYYCWAPWSTPTSVFDDSSTLLALFTSKLQYSYGKTINWQIQAPCCCSRFCWMFHTFGLSAFRVFLENSSEITFSMNVSRFWPL